MRIPALFTLALCLGCGRAPLARIQAAGAQTPTSVKCDAMPPAPGTPNFRLSVQEYVNTLADLFSENPALHTLLEAVSMNIAQLPRDGEAGATFSRMDRRVSQRHVDTYLEVADGIGRAVVDSDQRLSALSGSCALSDELDDDCFGRFVKSFGRRVFRRPLTDAEAARLNQLVERGQPARAVYRRAITELLAAPQFLFHIERGTASAPGHPGWYALTPYELASRLSYHFWQSMPDERLLGAAESGALSTEQGYRAEVERLSNHHRARSTWYRFFKEWLKLDDFGGFALDPAFYSFAGNVETTPALYDDAVWEIEQLVGYYTFDAPGSYPNLMTSDLIVTRSPRLAKLYDVEPWDGRSRPERFPAGQRSGLFTRAALLISASHTTNPFRRGAFVKKSLLCDSITRPPQLPPGALSLPAFDKHASTRARYERKVETADCRGCHALFSPYGYALEAFDALGRYRSYERLLDDAGEDQGKTPIEARIEVQTGGGQAVRVDGPVELSRMLASSPAATECFARQYFRFTFRREETPSDACTLAELERAHSKRGLAGVFRDVAFSFAFRHRTPASEAGSALLEASTTGVTP